MEEKEINSIAAAVSAAVGKLNADTKEKEKGEGNPETPETFNCPECGTKVNARTIYCPGCGVELEWGD